MSDNKDDLFPEKRKVNDFLEEPESDVNFDIAMGNAAERRSRALARPGNQTAVGTFTGVRMDREVSSEIVDLLSDDPLSKQLASVIEKTDKTDAGKTIKDRIMDRIRTPKGAIAILIASVAAYFFISNTVEKMHVQPLKPGYYMLHAFKEGHTLPNLGSDVTVEFGMGSCIYSDGDASEFGYSNFKGLKGMFEKHYLHVPPQAGKNGWQKSDVFIIEDNAEFVSETKPANCIHYHFYTTFETLQEIKKHWWYGPKTVVRQKPIYHKDPYKTMPGVE